MRFAIFVREGDQTYDRVNEVPEQLRKRTLAVRSFDKNGMMVDNLLVDGRELEPAIEKLLKPTNDREERIRFDEEDGKLDEFFTSSAGRL
jgi:hypothetical protein